MNNANDTITVEMNAQDLADWLTGRSVREWKKCIGVVNTVGPEVWINSHPDIAQMLEKPHKEWFNLVLTDELVQDFAKNLAMAGVIAGKRKDDDAPAAVLGPWEPEVA